MITYLFPGQGSQTKGMGGTLFDEFSERTKKADVLLGYSIKALCLDEQDHIVRNLADQITHSVRWAESMEYLLEQGEMEFEELGVGDVLTKLMKTIQNARL